MRATYCAFSVRPYRSRQTCTSPTVRGIDSAPMVSSKARWSPSPVFVSVSLGRILPHLHAASGPPADDEQHLDRLLPPLAPPLGVSIILGVPAVAAQLTAAGRERELNARQQEFITRVTHELKTPSAGIRVMAETLQLGATKIPKPVINFSIEF